MSDFEIYVQNEFPRRSVLLTKVRTGGYDGNPNDPGAPDIIDLAPIGTWYREETAGKWWRKIETVWEEQGAGPGPTNNLSTKENMTWEVDYATGVSPPDGTIITSQAEYDALGAPLAYMQDVARVRPAFIPHRIKVMVLAGDQFAMPNNLYAGAPGSMLFIDTEILTDRFVPIDMADWFYPPYLGVGIVFIGETADVAASVAGTWSQNAKLQWVFTRTSGTWTVDELKNCFAEILTGPQAGMTFPLTSYSAGSAQEFNSATEFPSPLLISAGAGTVRIYRLTTKVHAYEPDLTPSYGGLFLIGTWTTHNSDTSPYHAFYRLDFCEEPAPTGNYIFARSSFQECTFHGLCEVRGQMVWFYVCQVEIRWDSLGGLDIDWGATPWVTTCHVYGGSSSGELFYSRGAISPLGTIDQITFRASAAFVNWMWRLVFGGFDVETNYGQVLLLGNRAGGGSCSGVRITAHGGKTIIKEEHWITIWDTDQQLTAEYGQFWLGAFVGNGGGHNIGLAITYADVQIRSGLIDPARATYPLYLDGETLGPADVAGIVVGDTIYGIHDSRVQIYA